MLERMVLVKPALASILLEDETGLGVDFSKSEWDLLEKVVKSLKPFDDATKLLSFTIQHRTQMNIAMQGFKKNRKITSFLRKMKWLHLKKTTFSEETLTVIH